MHGIKEKKLPEYINTINLQKNYKEDWSNQTVTTYTNETGILNNIK